GSFTHHSPGIGLGACGTSHSSNEYTVALGYQVFDPHTPDGNGIHNTPFCKTVRASYNDKSINVTVTDRCPSCSGNDTDLSTAAFESLAPLASGVVSGTWEFV
ncbi:RlpA-like double-psi beta-barrel-protein domain-containing protein-containing protein, partial [Immersiella caudata]